MNVDAVNAYFNAMRNRDAPAHRELFTEDAQLVTPFGTFVRIDRQRACQQPFKLMSILHLDRDRFGQGDERRRKLPVGQSDLTIEVLARACRCGGRPPLTRRLVRNQEPVNGAGIEVGIQLKRAIDERLSDRLVRQEVGVVARHRDCRYPRGGRPCL